MTSIYTPFSIHKFPEIGWVEACRIDLTLVEDESGSIGGDKGINYWE